MCAVCRSDRELEEISLLPTRYRFTCDNGQSLEVAGGFHARLFDTIFFSLQKSLQFFLLIFSLTFSLEIPSFPVFLPSLLLVSFFLTEDLIVFLKILNTSVKEIKWEVRVVYLLSHRFSQWIHLD